MQDKTTTAKAKKPSAEIVPEKDHMEEFVNLVQAMRMAQKTYFRTRSYDNLNKSKMLEAQVDREIKRITHPDNQEELPL